MTPLQKIAMGLVVILLAANFGDWDGLPDPIGWLLVLLGVRAARTHLPNATAMTALGGLALVISAITYPPHIAEDLEPAAQWLLDLPQLAFEVVLCSALATVLAPNRSFRILMWVLVLVSVAPALALGSDNPSIADVTLTAFAVTQIALIWMLFSQSLDPRTGAQPRPPRPARTTGLGNP